MGTAANPGGSPRSPARLAGGLGYSGLLLLALLSPRPLPAADVTVRSGPAQVSLLELYTSEGCSSCPPAERWLSSLRQDPRLWKEIVPLAFHVDYWDGLGWRDPFASPLHSARQRRYAVSWARDTVYTPGFVLNGREWQRHQADRLVARNPESGRLSATLHDGGALELTFHPPPSSRGAWEAHAALLGFDRAIDVKAGENGGRQLVHDFVVLAMDSAAGTGENSRLSMHLPAEKIIRGSSAFAVWMTEAGKLTPIQAAGGGL